MIEQGTNFWSYAPPSFDRILTKLIFDGRRIPYGYQMTRKKMKVIFRKKEVAHFYSECNAYFKYVILFEKYFGQKK
jgi:hypothetical protein